MYGRFNEVLSNIKSVKSANNESGELAYLRNNIRPNFSLVKKQSIYWHKNNFKRKILVNIVYVLIYALIVWQLKNGDISVGGAVALVQFTSAIRMPLEMINWLVTQAQSAIANSRDYFKVLDQKLENKNGEQTSIKFDSIEFENVNFKYKNHTVLKKMSFKIEKGEKVAFVGESGGGKTTITNLMLGFYNVGAGKIKYGDLTNENISKNDIRNNFSLVLQEPAIFSGTITENIAYGVKKTKSEILAAAKNANAYEFIENLDGKFEAEVGERGVKLSGGQKQRIAIARAIVKDAPILILDEATSNLDSKSEKFVQDAIEKLMRNKTVIIIAHRLSTIAKVDKIITLKDGKIDEIGSPAELAKTGGVYSQLLNLQQGDNNKVLKKFELLAK